MMESNIQESTFSFKMILLGMIVISPTILIGMTTEYAAIALPQMKLNISNASWFGSIPAFAAPIGSLLIGIIIDKGGRRTALLCSVLPSIFGWLCLYWDYNWITALTGQFLNGIGSGSFGFPAQVYAGECIMVNNVTFRNNFLSWLGISMSFGMCSILLMGYFLRYQYVAATVSAIAFFIFMLIYTFIPESPSWLYKQGRIGDAEWSQKKLGIHQSILQNNRESAMIIVYETDRRWMKEYWKKITRKDVYTPLIKMSILFLILTCTGALAVMTYLVQVINEVSISANTTLSVSESYKYSAVSGILMLISNCLVCTVVCFLGVKKILMFSLVCMSIGLAIIGYTTIQVTYTTELVNLHIIAICFLIFMTNFGVLNLPNAILGDVFPADAKGFAGTVCVIEYFITAAILKLHPFLRVAFGGYLYFGYAIIAVIAALYVFFFMIETVGKTLNEINRELS